MHNPAHDRLLTVSRPGGEVLEDQTEKSNRTIFDQKCVTCGTWMQRSVNVTKKGAKLVTYSCPECGLSYTVEE
jgi:predicted RNA-binding Zn-ribbon protein involved in translation (DUF1610 family)